MSQLIHKCRKIHAILCDISCGTTCKKLTLLTSSSIKQRGSRSCAAVVLSQVEISLLNEQASKKLARLVTAAKT